MGFQEDVANRKLLSSDLISFNFQSEHANLGVIEILFNNFGKINNDKLLFRIKEQGTNDWYYENTYATSLMDSAQYFPFGFPVINNSKNKNYLITITSISGKKDDAVSISNEKKYFQAKYIFSKDYLLKNKNEIPYFIKNKLQNYTYYIENSEWMLAFFIFLTPVAFWLITRKLFPKFDKQIANNINNLKINIKNNWPLLLILAISIISRIKYLDYSHYWDGATYWFSFMANLGNIKNTFLSGGNILRSLLENLNILGHPSMGYMFYMSIGQLISNGDEIIFNIQNMLLALGATIGFYNIVKYFFPKNNIENYLITFIFTFSPLIYATSIFFNLDFPLLVFEVLMISALIYKKYFWVVVWSLLLIFSKETGILIYFSFMSIFIFLFSIFKLFNFKKMNKFQIISFIIPTLIFTLYMIFTKGMIWSSLGSTSILSGSLFKCELSSMFCFKFSKSNIETILHEVFKMNFSWIMTIIIFLGFTNWIINLLKDKNKEVFLSKEKKIWFIVHILTFNIFVVFNLLFFVMPFPRYIVAGVYFLIFIFYITIQYLFKDKKILRLMILTCLSILSFIQVFKSLDPYASLLVKSIIKGDNISSPLPSLRDAMVYNVEFVNLEKLERLVIEELIDKPPVVIDARAEYLFKDMKYAGTLSSLETLRNVGFNKLTYVFFPWFDPLDNSLNGISEFYKPIFYKTVSYEGYSVDIYNLEVN